MFFFLSEAGFRKVQREPLAQVFSSEFCEILRIPLFIEHLRWVLLVIFILIWFSKVLLIESISVVALQADSFKFRFFIMLIKYSFIKSAIFSSSLTIVLFSISVILEELLSLSLK